MWSVGTVLYALFYKRLPFLHKKRYRIRNEVRTASVVFAHPIPKDAESMIMCLLNRDSSMRYSCQDVFSHKYWKAMTKQLKLPRIPNSSTGSPSWIKCLLPFLRSNQVRPLVY